jgi:hypothetical protein
VERIPFRTHLGYVKISSNHQQPSEVILKHSLASARKRLSALVFSCLALCFAAALHGQAIGSTLNGVVLDEQGKGVYPATVTVRNGSGAAKTTKTDGSGHYSIEGLPAGTYSLAVIANGFATGSKTGVTVAAWLGG